MKPERLKGLSTQLFHQNIGIQPEAVVVEIIIRRHDIKHTCITSHYIFVSWHLLYQIMFCPFSLKKKNTPDNNRL